ncbi:MAG: hypothetical protein P8172_13465 [Gammaproteobacteria bacterium]|jgi:hypothetical protein
MNGRVASNTSATAFGIALVTASALLIAACAFQRPVPDPARIEQQIAASKAEELDLVRSTIGEPERARRFIDLLAERERIVRALAGQILAHKQQMARLNADYGAERSDFEAQLADYNRQRATGQKALVDLITEMKQTTTADEWAEISAFQLERLDLRKLMYRGLAKGS